MPEREHQEERTEQLIQVRRVTALDRRRARGPGAFTVQLILDDGADGYILRPTPDDADVLLALWTRTEGATFDLARKVLVFGPVTP